MARLALLPQLLLLLLALARGELVQGPWSDRSLPPGERARRLVSNMTLAEKMSMLHGPLVCESQRDCAYVGNVAAIERLGIPPITMNDGPQGFRNVPKELFSTSTAWPSGLAMGATWDADAAYEWGAGMGKEFFDKGSNVQLGPGLCVARVPRGGRNFEYMSGEDPFLGKVLVQPAVRGIQSQKVVANAKHWVNNNQETDRMFVSADVDERTRFEMYYPPFEGAIAADVGSFMCGYNKINGQWSCENPTTLAHDLKEVLGFQGYVMSDWGATHSTSIMAGLDMEMPNALFMNPLFILGGLATGEITQAAIDDAVTRIVRPMFAVGVMDEPVASWSFTKIVNNVTTDASAASARKLAAASTVLLKNDGGLLPLPQGKKVALIGFADQNAVIGGGGSGSVVPSYLVSPREGITMAAGGEVSYADGTDLTHAAALAAAADIAVVFVGTSAHEGADRPSLSLDDGCELWHGQCEGNANKQNAMVEAIAKANLNTVVVVSTPGAVLMPWSQDVSAILLMFMPGQQIGNAVADLLYGKVKPAAKLPLTMPNAENETALSPAQWPGVGGHAVYSEKFLVGYRYYDHVGIQFTTGFPFGHGLSYTSFTYSDLSVEGQNVSFVVANSGKVAGSEVAQLYLGFPPQAGEPPLKGFRKTATLAPGASERVTLSLAPRDLSIWDEVEHRWSAVPGVFQVRVGASSRDLRLSGALQHQATLEFV